ncbi:hypothetical protein GETHPA_12160 [Geothrix rubra]|uniref:Nuclear transport factor 2 family protein n=1 Tax=Geothrix rubra TaxID=2927977 RepID=A0ABQ5Q4Q8_9BACT|nr:hypothetical protein [Geothrix rubra]GLH69683.1 hypothetical protein GETHPA_12160 [Geothrix rubra]
MLRGRRSIPFLLLALAACGRKAPEDQVRAAFEACRTAVEAGDAARAAAPLDADFRGPEGMDRATARLFLAGLLRRERVGVTVIRNQLRRDGPDILQEVDLVLTGRGGGLLPEEASRRSFLLRWRQRGGDWKLAELQSPEGP